MGEALAEDRTILTREKSSYTFSMVSLENVEVRVETSTSNLGISSTVSSSTPVVVGFV